MLKLFTGYVLAHGSCGGVLFELKPYYADGSYRRNRTDYSDNTVIEADIESKTYKIRYNNH